MQRQPMHAHAEHANKTKTSRFKPPSCSKAKVIINESPMCLVCDAKCFTSPNYTVYKPQYWLTDSYNGIVMCWTLGPVIY